jgi:anti-sigma factor ChrR (cupin superfamily)
MQVHADLTQRVVAFADEAEWVATPADGVERRTLDRDDGEAARSTSIDRFLSAGRLDRHRHGLGEELLVLKGTFADEFGEYPAGTYVRNPPGSVHQHGCEEGCALFVKLGQFHPDDSERVVVDTREAEWFPGLVKGLAVLPVHRFGSELVSLVRWAPGTVFHKHQHSGGEEILVLEGALEDEHGRYPTGAWLRNPPGSRHMPFSLDGCLIYVKTGHLPAVRV